MLRIYHSPERTIPMLPYERLQACVAAIRQKTDFAPRTALVLGSGLGTVETGKPGMSL